MGRTRLWSIEFEQGEFRTSEGLVDGKLSTSKWTQAEGTNTGKANQRGPVAQAEFEARAKWQKKRDTGYAESVEESGAEYVECMLAHPLIEYKSDGTIKKERTKDLAFPLAMQPKLDGHRCLVYIKDGKPYAQSRKGKPILSVPHILAECEPILKANPGLVLDGELYNHEFKHDFEALSSLIRKQNPSAEELAQSKRVLQYHVYDLASEQGSFFARSGRIVSLLRRQNGATSLHIVQTMNVLNLAEMEDYEADCVELGYEGAMVRDWSSLYQAGRRECLIKAKRFIDEEFPIVRVEEGKGDRKGLASRIVVRLPNGNECGAGVIGNNPYAARLFKDRARLTGRQITIKFLGYTKDGNLRAAKAKCLRYD